MFRVFPRPVAATLSAANAGPTLNRFPCIMNASGAFGREVCRDRVLHHSFRRHGRFHGPDAGASLANEPAYRRFDVCNDFARPDQVFLCELYAVHAGFDVHLDSDHFAKFDAAVAPIFAAKAVQTFATVNQ